MANDSCIPLMVTPFMGDVVVRCTEKELEILLVTAG